MLNLKNWLPEIEKEVTVAESIATLIAKLAADVLAVQHDPQAIATLISDLEADIPEIVAAVKANTVAAAEPAV